MRNVMFVFGLMLALGGAVWAFDDMQNVGGVGGGVWIDTATSTLNMNSYGITNAGTVSMVGGVVGAGGFDLDGRSLIIGAAGESILMGDRATAVGPGQIQFKTTIDEPTGNEIAYYFPYTVDKLTSGNDSGLVVNLATDTSSPGTTALIDVQYGGASKFSCSGTGDCTSAARFQSAAIYSSGSGRFSSYISTLNSGAYITTENNYKTILTSSGNAAGCGSTGACIDHQKAAYFGDGTYSQGATAGQVADSAGDVLVEGDIEGPKTLIDSTGGFSVLMKNSSGYQPAGIATIMDTATDSSFLPVAADGHGVNVFGISRSACARGAWCWITILGIANVLLEDGQGCKPGYVCAADGTTTAGRVDCDTTAHTGPNQGPYSLETKSSGTNVTCKALIVSPGFN